VLFAVVVAREWFNPPYIMIVSLRILWYEPSHDEGLRKYKRAHHMWLVWGVDPPLWLRNLLGFRHGM
jgi:hypothetical protein